MQTSARPTILKGLGRGWRVYVSRFGEVLRLMFYELVLRMAALSPLLFLAEPSLRFLALLCIPMYLCIVLPARQSAADAMQQSMDGGPLFNERLYRGRVAYPLRVLHGLKAAVCVLLWIALWGAALTGVGAWLYRLYAPAERIAGSNDILTLLKTMLEAFQSEEPVTAGLFFGTVRDMLAGTAENGAVLRILPHLLIILLGGFTLFTMIALAFHSGRRHEYPHGGKRIRGFRFRFRTMLVWLISLLPALPVAAAAAYAVRGYLSDAIGQLKQMQLSLPAVDWTIWLLLGVSAVLLFLLVPLRSLLTAGWVREIWADDEEK